MFSVRVCVRFLCFCLLFVFDSDDYHLVLCLCLLFVIVFDLESSDVAG